jgi:serine/threonine-protein kinase
MDYEVIFYCPKCDNELHATSDLCGENVECLYCGNEVKVPIPGLDEGLEIGDFVLKEKLGSGGMGEVWLADQLSMNRLVALKILSPGLVKDQSFVDRFLKEAEMAGKLEHPNIITAYTAGCIGDYYYLATSYVDGIELHDKLKIEGPLKEREALKIIRGIAVALNYAWNEHRLLHRDIKPGNIMLDKRGVPKLMDMGISKSLLHKNLQTRDGMIVGTPDYISPEQAQAAEDIDFRSDIYSLGATLYHLLTGVAPYQAKTSRQLMKMHVNAPIPDPININHKVTGQCAELIRVMMSKDRDGRQSSWNYVVDDIDAVLAGRYPVSPKIDLSKKKKQVESNIKFSSADDNIQLSIDKPIRRTIYKNQDSTADSDVTMKMDSSATMRMDTSEEEKHAAEIEPNKPAVKQEAPTPEPEPTVKVPPPKAFNAKSKRGIFVNIIAIILLLIIIAAGCWFFLKG